MNWKDLLRFKRSPEEIAAEQIAEAKAKMAPLLNLSGLGLTVWPAALGELKHLLALYLYGNQLRELPPALGELTQLQSLWLQDNQLREVPSALGELKELEDLRLHNNQLRELPSALGELKQLQELHLGGNQLRELPSALGELTQLRSLFLHGNPDLGLPPEVLGPPLKSIATDRKATRVPAQVILDYYFSRQRGGRPLNEVKLVIVGRGGAGKSSLVEQLVHGTFTKGKSETGGVALCDWEMKDCPGGGPVTAHVWDFAGQVITHSTHQFFFSARALYVLVLTGRENSERDDAEYWLRLIEAFGSEEPPWPSEFAFVANAYMAEGEEWLRDIGKLTTEQIDRFAQKLRRRVLGPPTILALNKWDEPGSRPRIDRRALRERFPFIVEIIETDCQTATGIAKLKETLCRVAGEMKWVRDVFPEEFRKVKDRLQTMEEPHLGYDRYRALCRENGVPDEGKQDSVAEILHRLGVALNYRDDPRLRDATVLKPHWLTENVYALVRHAERHAGVLRRDELSAVLPAEQDPAMREYLVRIMERFELAYPVGEAEAGREARQWLVPLGLPDDQPAGVESFSEEPDAATTRLRYRYMALPAGLVARFTVRVHPFIEGEARWASGVVLALEGARALVRSLVKDEVEITVTGEGPARQQLAGLCQREFREIHAGIAGLNPVEETRAAGEWVRVETLEKDEAQKRQTGVATGEGTVPVEPSVKLNEFTAPAARDDSWKPRVFISYSKHDAEKRRQLALRLKVLATAGLVDAFFHDRMIQAGEDWDERIKRELEESDVIVFLVSAEMLATDYVTKVELARAMERRAEREAVVVPVILEPCDWQETKLSSPNALPEKGRPLTSYTPRANGWQVVSEGLKGLFTELREKREG